MGAAQLYKRIALDVSGERREASALEEFLSASRRAGTPH
jgi:hypothetical protein